MTTNKPGIAICVGAAKSGTSWLFKCLEEHPDISAATGKEINFFLKPSLVCDDFFSYFEEKEEIKWYFEGSTNYLHTEETTEKIHDCFPRAKIIILLRDPYSRARSHFGHMINNKKYPEEITLDKAEVITPEIITGSMYQIHVPRFERVFGNDNVLVLQYERIATEPQRIIDEVCAFLNIESITPKFLNIRYNTGKARTNPLYLKVRSWYIKSRRYAVTRALINLLRRIGFHSGVLERILSFHTRKNNIQLSDEDLKIRLSEAKEFYDQRFSY